MGDDLLKEQAVVGFQPALPKPRETSGHAERDPVAVPNRVAGDDIDVLARMRRVKGHHTLNALRLGQTSDHRCGHALSVGDHSCRRMTQRKDQAGDVQRRRAQVVAVRGFVREAVAAEIHGDGVVIFREQGEDGLPVEPSAGETVNQQH